MINHLLVFSQPSIYIDGWLYGMRMTSVVCNVPVLSQNDSTYHHSVFTTWKWHPFATWTPSFIILVRKLKKKSQKYQRTVGYPSTSWASCRRSYPSKLCDVHRHPQSSRIRSVRILFFTYDKGGGICFRPHARARLSVCLSICLCARLLKMACVDLDEMLHVDRCRDMDELINFWARSGFQMPELDCFLRYRIRCNSEFYYVGKIPRIGIGMGARRCSEAWF